MKNLFTLYFLLLFSDFSFAQHNFHWAKVMEGAGQCDVYATATDPLGNLYIAGFFEGTTDFDPGLQVYNLTSTWTYRYDIFIAKLDSLGNFKWAKQIPVREAFPSRMFLDVDTAGNIYTAGNFNDTVDFDPGPGVFEMAGGIFITQFDSMGNMVWAKRLAVGAAGGTIGSMYLDRHGSIYITGAGGSTLDFDPGPATFTLPISPGDLNAFAAKYSGNGDLVWALSPAQKNNHSTGASAICSDVAGNLYIVGAYSGTADFDPGPGIYEMISSGLGDAFISKLDSSGQFVWAKRIREFGANSSCALASIYANDSGGVVIGGYFSGSIDVDPSPSTVTLSTINAGRDILILKLDTSGTYIWAQPLDGQWASLNVMKLDAWGNIYMAYTNYLPQSGSSEAGLVMCSPTGTPIWQNTLGNTSGDTYGRALYIDKTGSIYFSGTFRGDNDFDPSSATYNIFGYDDGFVQKLGFGTVSGVSALVDRNINVYPNPSSDKFRIEIPQSMRNVKVIVFDMMGQVVYERLAVDGAVDIDLSLQPSGSYFLSLSENGYKSSVQLLKQ